ncbi:hypothetical protein HK098_002001 [Nowakowskiella sp. JEL0407]|nr:hypothetical protein HK098_002001 [Nowakowskiella sp. JEL0407]
MSRRQNNGRRNAVRGPTSALTSFLQERGISARNMNPYQRRAPANDGAEATENVEEGESQTIEPAEEQNESSSISNMETSEAQEARSTTAASSSQIRAPAETETTSSTSKTVKRKRSTAKKKAESDDDVFEDDFGDWNKHTPRSTFSKRTKSEEKSIWNVPNSTGAVRKAIKFCAKCTRRFLPSDLESESSICGACEGIDGSKSSARKKKALKKMLVAERSDGVSSLRELCVKMVADYIDCLEEFGDISEKTKVKISKILSRRRLLDGNNMKLFLGPQERRVELFDCTKIDCQGFEQIAYFCPNVETLNLSLCGRMRDSVLMLFGEKLGNLSRITLSGCFLVTDAAFSSIFGAIGPRLLELNLHHAAKLTSVSVKVLVTDCVNVEKLTLDQCTGVDNDALIFLKSLKNLKELRLNCLGANITNDMITTVISEVGKNLSCLSLNGYPGMTDQLLITGIAANCKRLIELSLAECENLTEEGMVQFLIELKGKSQNDLVSLNLYRNVNLKDDTLNTIVNLYGHSLRFLNINGLDELTPRSLMCLSKSNIAGHPNKLEELDISWVRALDDDVFLEFVRNLSHLETIRVWGCNKLTEASLMGKQWKNGAGRLIRVVGNEFD